MRGLWAGLLALLATPLWGQQATDAVAPEWGQAPVADVAQVQAAQYMVVAAHPLAAQAGADVLAQGGTAADAMVAVQAVLGLVEPQSSGLGGGAFLLWFDAASGQITTLDGRETAPLAATPRLFQHPDGTPMGFFDAVVGGRSVGVPGTPALLTEAHRRWGQADWAGLFQPAIALAEDGFSVSPRLAAAVARDAARLASQPGTARYFVPDGQPLAAGARLKNPDYAASLRLLAREGAAPFYTGTIARDIVAAVQGASPAGLLAPLDLAIYRVKDRSPLCLPYRGHEICGMGPPSSGALAVGQILGTLAQGPALPPPTDVQAWRRMGDASRLAFADRGRYVADSDFVPVPAQGMLEPAYLQARAGLMVGPQALAPEQVQPGQPRFQHSLNWADDQALELPSTTHISIVDGYGNALSMTSTIENGFGSRVMVRGYLLNNELTDFSFRSHQDGRAIANAVAPGKRPRSSMAPTIVLRQGVPVLILGSPGGSRIIPFVANTLVAMLDWGMGPAQAVAMPHMLNRFGTFELEQGTAAEAMAAPLQALGYEVKIGPLNSGLHVISRTPDGTGWLGAADPRREGQAMGR
ncbi:MAG: gamma-glutamyltransferase [Rhodobacteraceae bacterium]|nr:gamma-glutamyltransferase [Paracoccaceae bacterium]